MTTVAIPSLRIEPELRDAAERVLQEGETLSSLVEASIRDSIARSEMQAEFSARGLASHDHAPETERYTGALAKARAGE